MVELGVVVESVTVIGEEKLPGMGENAGVTTVPCVYVAEPIAEVPYPVAVAIHFMVVVAETGMGAVYTGDEVVGVDPFVVQ